MTQLAKLQSAMTLGEVAAFLGFKAKALSFILYRLQDPQKYTTFEIPKRFGGVRQISAPAPRLKLLQQRLSITLQNCVDEIAEENIDRRP
jgi:RNA-directed DNA polymerase